MTIDLQPFCADPENTIIYHHDMTRPWFENGWMYATDGRILVRLKSEPRPLRDKTPDAASLFREFDPGQCMDELPQWDGGMYHYQDPCEHPQCHDGKISGGNKLCSECGGKGWTPESMCTTVTFQDTHFQGKYLKAIHTLPNPLGYLRARLEPDGTTVLAQLWVTFDGGQCLLMPTTNIVTTDGIQRG